MAASIAGSINNICNPRSFPFAARSRDERERKREREQRVTPAVAAHVAASDDAAPRPAPPPLRNESAALSALQRGVTAAELAARVGPRASRTLDPGELERWLVDQQLAIAGDDGRLVPGELERWLVDQQLAIAGDDGRLVPTARTFAIGGAIK